MSSATDPRPQRTLRLAAGVAAATAVSYGLAMPMPFVAPVFTLFLLATRTQPLPLNAVVGVVVLVTLTTSVGLLLIPMLEHAPASGVLLIGLALFLCFRYLLRGGSSLAAMFLMAGLTLISAAGTASFDIAKLVIEALATGLLTAGAMVAISHLLFPDPAVAPVPAPTPVAPPIDVGWIALRATLVVLPSFLLALINPAAFMPLIFKSIAVGQQACVTRARDAAREVIGSTLLGGLLAMLFWNLLTVFAHLWMLFLWTLLFSLLVARKLYALSRTRLTPGMWLNTLTTMLILLGQSIQDSAEGKDVYTAFALRMGLFVSVSVYACAMIVLIDRRRDRAPANRATT